MSAQQIPTTANSSADSGQRTGADQLPGCEHDFSFAIQCPTCGVPNLLIKPGDELDSKLVAAALRRMARRAPDYDARFDSGELGSTPLIRPYELASEFIEAYAAARKGK